MPEAWQPIARGRDIDLGQLKEVARELLAAAGNIRVWLVEGEMGSGKTTLIKAIGEILGVTETMSSPTFSIVNEYNTGVGDKLYHFDLYRLKNEKEVIDIGTAEYLDSGQHCLVEWPEKLGSLTPAECLKIRIGISGPHHRKIEYQRP